MPNLRALRNAGKPISTGPFAMLPSSNHPLDSLKTPFTLRLTAIGLFSSSFFATDTTFKNGRTRCPDCSARTGSPVALLLRDSS